MPLSPWRGACISLALLVAPSLARAADAQCAPAYENAQLLRQRGKLVDAREAALLCARAVCPEIARRDCAAWAEQLHREIPSVTIIARDAATGEDRGARITIDGAARPEAATGRAIELDPGPHVFRVERAGDETIEQTITVFQGERDRILRFALRHPEPPPPRAIEARPAPPPPPEQPKSTPTLGPAFVVAGASLVLLGTSAALGLSGRSDLAALRTSCAPACSDDDVDPVRRRLIVSDVTLGAGVLGAAVAIYLFARPPQVATSSARLDVGPGAITLRGSF